MQRIRFGLESICLSAVSLVQQESLLEREGASFLSNNAVKCLVFMSILQNTKGRNLNLTAITHVYAIQVTSDDPDEECETGEHVSKIFSQMTK